MMTALGFNLSLVKSDKKAYDKGRIDEIPNPWMNWPTMTVGIEFAHPPIATTKFFTKTILESPTKTIDKQSINASFLLLVSDTKFMTSKPKIHPTPKIDWRRSLAH